jgi:HPt (histidine-containing phosphotransfer) domain-containing protein
MKATDGDLELFGELLDMFREQYPQMLTDLGEAVSAGDPARIREAAHAIKGTLANLGAIAATETALELETMGRQAQIDRAAEVFQSLRVAVREFEEATSNQGEAVDK